MSSTTIANINIPLLATLLALVPLASYYLIRYLFRTNSVDSQSKSKSLLGISAQRPPLPPPTEIIGLRIYPIKSCRGFSVSSARLLSTGLDLDRNWMFVSFPDREFVTIRNNPLMTLIDTAFDADKDELHISIKSSHLQQQQDGDGDSSNQGGVHIAIPAHPSRSWLESNAHLSPATIWSQQTDGWEYSPSLTQPIASFLSQDVRLVYKGPTPRVLRGSGALEHLGRTGSTKFADMLPVQVSSMASMAELNGRLRRQGEAEITIERFRPNIIVRGSEAWDEDGWKAVRISSADGDGDGKKALELDVACRCLRCQVPNVNPDTAEKHKKQPWDTLMSYRRIDKGMRFKPGFGMLCVPRGEGELSVGMKFEVTATTNDHFFISPMK
jgi:uncharacterized protein